MLGSESKWVCWNHHKILAYKNGSDYHEYLSYIACFGRLSWEILRLDKPSTDIRFAIQTLNLPYPFI